MGENKGVILVTGCSGRIGTRAAITLGKRGYSIVGFDKVAPQGEAASWIDFYLVDLGSDRSVSESLEKVRAKYGSCLTSVLHLAAYYSFAGEHPELYETITVRGSERMIMGMKLFEKVEQFLFSSTQLIYEPCQVGEKIDENSPISSSWGYPLSKIQTEKLLKEKHESIPLVFLRIAGCYDDECHSIPISNQIQRIYENQLESLLFPGNLAHGSPFLHLDDLIDSMVLCIEKRHQLGSFADFIIGEEKTLSYDEMQRRIFTLIHGKARFTLRIPKWFAKLGALVQNMIPGFETFIKPWMIDVADAHYELNIDKAKKLLGWTPKHFVVDTLPLMIDTLKKDPVRWYRLNGLKMPAKILKKIPK